MEVTQLIAEYGEWFYLVTLVWTFLEGETFVLFAGLAAKHGAIRLDLLILCAWTGSFLGDQFYFAIGRLYGTRLLARFPRWKPGVDQALGWLKRYDTAFVLSYRFIYGVRNFSSFALGISPVSWRRFLVLNFIAAGVWAVIFSLVGYVAGAALEKALGDLHFGIGVALLVVFVVIMTVALRMQRRKPQPTEAVDPAKTDQPAD
jgi:membrane protein DedA with SNARE-associated domain